MAKTLFQGFVAGILLNCAVLVLYANPEPTESSDQEFSVQPTRTGEHGFKPITRASQKSSGKGIQWLLQIQKPSGAWSCEPDKPSSVSITSLAMLAIMSGGESLDRSGPRQKALRRGLDWILDRPSHGRGFVSTYDATGLGPIYDHANAVLLLSQLHGHVQYRADEVQRTLERAVEFLEQFQWENGGWGRKQPNLGITGSVFQSLRSADSSGVSVDANFRRTIRFAERCSLSSGGFTLTPDGSRQRLFWSTSAGARVLMGVGEREELVKRSFRRMRNRKLGVDYDGKISEWDYAGLLMMTQAMMHERGENWSVWYPMIRGQLLKKQNKDGSWEVEYCKECRGFATSVAVLFLRSPNLLLPIFQR